MNRPYYFIEVTAYCEESKLCKNAAVLKKTLRMQEGALSFENQSLYLCDNL